MCVCFIKLYKELFFFFFVGKISLQPISFVAFACCRYFFAIIFSEIPFMYSFDLIHLLNSCPSILKFTKYDVRKRKYNIYDKVLQNNQSKYITIWKSDTRHTRTTKKQTKGMVNLQKGFSRSPLALRGCTLI